MAALLPCALPLHLADAALHYKLAKGAMFIFRNYISSRILVKSGFVFQVQILDLSPRLLFDTPSTSKSLFRPTRLSVHAFVSSSIS